MQQMMKRKQLASKEASAVIRTIISEVGVAFILLIPHHNVVHKTSSWCIFCLMDCLLHITAFCILKHIARP
jgi:hypothetical protein